MRAAVAFVVVIFALFSLMEASPHGGFGGGYGGFPGGGYGGFPGGGYGGFPGGGYGGFPGGGYGGGFRRAAATAAIPVADMVVAAPRPQHQPQLPAVDGAARHA
ncbi:hypothetical protein ACLKA6_006693 [Drosophila palustris]